MNTPALMSRSELDLYAAGLTRMAKKIRGRVGEYLASAARELRMQSDFGGEYQRRNWR